jgi:hypothetical protein
MMASCCDFRDAAARQFTTGKAAKELQAYRNGRLGPTTRLIRDRLVASELNHGSLLDIGGGNRSTHIRTPGVRDDEGRRRGRVGRLCCGRQGRGQPSRSDSVNDSHPR